MSVPQPSEGVELLEEFRRYLREHGLPVTTQREQVAEAVLVSAGHLSVEDIEQQLRGRGLHIGKATVYRTLDILARSGMITERDFGEGFRRYERVPGHPHHEHLICTRCGKVIEFTNERLERLKALVAEEYGFQHHHHRLDIYGLCRECQAKDAGASSPPSSSQSE
ncbi:MAG TPA: Fur family transcriptional regulator [Gemmatimonadales bacterium]|nr:Fur family transcriptional regulator [Gemmatimonadales bacterium]